MTHQELGPILQEATPRLESAVATYPGYGVGGERNALNHSSCGLATALLQEFLAVNHDIQTDRIVNWKIDKIPRSPTTWRHINHVLLYSPEHAAIIDPTYSQFMYLFGIDSIKGGNNPELIDLFPERKIGIIDVDAGREFAEGFVEHCVGARASAAAILGIDIIERGTFFETEDDAQIREAVAEIWNLRGYEPFPADATRTELYTRAYSVLNRH